MGENVDLEEADELAEGDPDQAPVAQEAAAEQAVDAESQQASPESDDPEADVEPEVRA